jgi:hypothetical protein
MSSYSNRESEVRCLGCGVEPSAVEDFVAFALEGWSVLCPECSLEHEASGSDPEPVRSLASLMAVTARRGVKKSPKRRVRRKGGLES